MRAWVYLFRVLCICAHAPLLGEWIACVRVFIFSQDAVRARGLLRIGIYLRTHVITSGACVRGMLDLV